MTVSDMVRITNAKILLGEDHQDQEISSAFCSDLMSDVLAFVNEDTVLITGLVNPHVIRTSEMLDLKCILFVRGKQPSQDILEAAAILHDIGIHEAERKYGSTSGKYQELEGAPLARAMLRNLGYEEDFTERVCYLVAHHHTYDQVDGQDYQILLEADFLVNAYEDQLSPSAIASFRDKIFQTASGKKLLESMYRQSGK